jgi:hypothetical protein
MIQYDFSLGAEQRNATQRMIFSSGPFAVFIQLPTRSFISAIVCDLDQALVLPPVEA